MENSKKWIEEVKKIRAEGSFEKTMSYLNEVLKGSPEDPNVHYQIAWTHDALGKESDAAPAYERAIALGLQGVELEGAYVGLGSTYRCLGDYQNSKRILEQGLVHFPENGALKLFLAMTLYNLKDHTKSVEILIKELIRTSSDPQIQQYERAFSFYADKLDQKFE